MRAVRLHSDRGPEGLSLDEIPEPEPREGEALVRVHAAAITRDELTWPVDRLPAVPSYELSGVVAALGPGAEGVAVGDAIFAMTRFDGDGVAAELAAVPAELLVAKPPSLSHVESAALPLPALSAWQGLFTHGGLEPGQQVRVHGANGAVGHLAVQLARHHGARVEVGAELVHLVFDTVGGDLLAGSAASVRPGGRVVSVAEEGPEGTMYFVVEPDRRQLAEIARLADNGTLRVAVDSVFPLTDAVAAFQRSMARGKRGKVVLQVAG